MTLSAHPTVSGTTYMAVSGHPAAFLAGSQILEAGGNAVDAGVAIGLCINVLESEMTGFAGVAPAMLRMATDGEVRNFVGVGPWPKNLDAAYFRENTTTASSTPWCRPHRISGSPPCRSSEPRHRGAEAAPRRLSGSPPCDFKELGRREIFSPHCRNSGTSLCRICRTLQFLADQAASRGVVMRALMRRTGLSWSKRCSIRKSRAGFRDDFEKPTRARFGDYELYGCGRGADR